MPFTNLRIPQLDSTGNDVADANFKAIIEHFRSLETWGVLTIGDVRTWTPVLTFATPGNLSVTYSSQYGTYIKVGQLIHAQFTITTSAFTHTTASGNCQITGLPLPATSDSGYNATGALTWTGITTAFTQINAQVAAGASIILLAGSASAAAFGFVGAATMPSGGTPAFRGSVVYRI